MLAAVRGSLWLRAFVSLALLAVVLLYADVGKVLDEVRKGDWRWFVASAGLMALATFVGGMRWLLFLRAVGLHVSTRRAVRVFAASLFLNNVLPTSVGGDAVRTWLVGRTNGGLVRAAVATLVDKTTAVVCLFAVAWAALVVDPDVVPDSVTAGLIWTTLGLVAAALVAALTAAGVRPIVRRLPPRVEGVVVEAWAAFRVLLGSVRLATSVVGLGVVYQALAVFSLVFAGRTVGLNLPFALAAVAVAIVVVAMLIPISIGGLGIREGGFVILLGEAGIDAAKATVVSLLSTAAVLTASAGVVALSSLSMSSVREFRRRSMPSKRTA